MDSRAYEWALRVYSKPLGARKTRIYVIRSTLVGTKVWERNIWSTKTYQAKADAQQKGEPDNENNKKAIRIMKTPKKRAG